jgi:hypothetical protein
VASASPQALPRLERWLAGLPRGLGAYPEALAKGSLARNVAEGQPAELAQRLPAPLGAYLTDPPLAGEWFPEAHLCGLILGIADLRRMSDTEVCAWARARNRALFQSPAYRILMAVVSPASLVRFAARRWENWHRGTRLEAEDLADGGARLTLRFPPGLLDGLVLRAYAQAFEVALELSRAPAPAVHLAEEAPGRASFLACW